MTFTATSTTTTLSFSSVNSANFWGPLLDNVSVTQAQAVPEPGSVALLGVGLAGLFFLRRMLVRSI